MEAAHRPAWRYALLLLLPLIAAGGADGFVRIDSRTDIASHREPDEQVRTTLQARLERIIAPGATPKKVAEGFTFTEGPTWLKGKLYFSDMWFKNPAAGDWTGSPARSRLIVMEPDGRYRVLAHGMQSNGTIAARTGNLIVCDTFGHRVVELDPANGRVRRVLLDRINGRLIDGPNDLVMDTKGEIYFTDPQFTPDQQKSPPGKQVYYIAPDGSARVVIGRASTRCRTASRSRPTAGRCM